MYRWLRQALIVNAGRSIVRSRQFNLHQRLAVLLRWDFPAVEVYRVSDGRQAAQSVGQIADSGAFAGRSVNGDGLKGFTGEYVGNQTG
jgi:hypothetical protein